MYSRLGLFRQINVLLYLNERWDVADGGCLELWAEGESAKPAKTARIPQMEHSVRMLLFLSTSKYIELARRVRMLAPDVPSTCFQRLDG